MSPRSIEPIAMPLVDGERIPMPRFSEADLRQSSSSVEQSWGDVPGSSSTHRTPASLIPDLWRDELSLRS